MLFRSDRQTDSLFLSLPPLPAPSLSFFVSLVLSFSSCLSAVSRDTQGWTGRRERGRLFTSGRSSADLRGRPPPCSRSTSFPVSPASCLHLRRALIGRVCVGSRPINAETPRCVLETFCHRRDVEMMCGESRHTFSLSGGDRHRTVP